MGVWQWGYFPYLGCWRRGRANKCQWGAAAAGPCLCSQSSHVTVTLCWPYTALLRHGAHYSAHEEWVSSDMRAEETETPGGQETAFAGPWEDSEESGRSGVWQSEGASVNINKLSSYQEKSWKVDSKIWRVNNYYLMTTGKVNVK